jgi:hypothetical protein
VAKLVATNETGQVSLLWNRYQAAFLQAKRERTKSGKRGYRILSLFAGRRGGKTKIGAVGAVEEMKPDTLGWACAPSYPELHDYVIPAVMQLIPKQWIASASESRLELALKNGARVAFRSLDDPNRARGPGLDWAWIDEARKIQKLAYSTMLPALLDKKGVLTITTTPNGQDWCFEEFWEPVDKGHIGFWRCRYHTADNPSIDPEEIEFHRRTMDPLFFAQEYEADFVTFAGAVYGSTINEQLLRTDEEIRQHFPEWPDINPNRRSIVGLDPGADHPFGSVLLVQGDKGMVAVGEHLARDASAFNHKHALYRMLATYNPAQPFQPVSWAIDRSQKQWAIELAQHPLPIYATAAENNVVAGIERVKSWVHTRQLWFIVAKVPRLVEQLRGYKWAQQEDSHEYKREAVVKKADDLPDALRYALMTWPEMPMAEEAPTGRDLSVFNDEQRWAMERLERIETAEKDRAEGIEHDRDRHDEDFFDHGYAFTSLGEAESTVGDMWL